MLSSAAERIDGPRVGAERGLLEPGLEDIVDRDPLVAELDDGPLVLADGNVPAFLLRDVPELTLPHARTTTPAGSKYSSFQSRSSTVADRHACEIQCCRDARAAS